MPRFVAVEGDAGDPAPMAGADLALRRELEAEVIAPHQVETVAVHDLVKVRDEQGGGAVEAVEVGRLVAQIRQVGGNAQTPDQGLAVEIGVEHRVSLGIAGSFHVDLPKIIGIDRTVSVLIDVQQRAVLESKVRGITDGRQRAEVETGFLDFFLGGSCADCCEKQRDRNQSFHCK